MPTHIFVILASLPSHLWIRALHVVLGVRCTNTTMAFFVPSAAYYFRTPYGLSNRRNLTPLLALFDVCMCGWAGTATACVPDQKKKRLIANCCNSKICLAFVFYLSRAHERFLDEYSLSAASSFLHWLVHYLAAYQFPTWVRRLKTLSKIQDFQERAASAEATMCDNHNFLPIPPRVRRRSIEMRSALRDKFIEITNKYLTTRYPGDMSRTRSRN